MRSNLNLDGSLAIHKVKHPPPSIDTAILRAFLSKVKKSGKKLPVRPRPAMVIYVFSSTVPLFEVEGSRVPVDTSVPGVTPFGLRYFKIRKS